MVCITLFSQAAMAPPPPTRSRVTTSPSGPARLGDSDQLRGMPATTNIPGRLSLSLPPSLSLLDQPDVVWSNRAPWMTRDIKREELSLPNIGGHRSYNDHSECSQMALFDSPRQGGICSKY